MRRWVQVVVVCILAVGWVPALEARKPPAQMAFIGYQVSVEPVVTERAPGRLQTHSLIWKLRAVYRLRSRRVVEILPLTPVGARAQARDTEVVVRRPWRPTDYPRRGPLMATLPSALRFFAKVRLSNRIGLLPDHVPPARARIPPVRARTRPVKTPAATCVQVLLKKGHSASLAGKCRGAAQGCAVVLLRAGHHPSNLRFCKPGMNLQCVQALIAKKHHPSHLGGCRGVETTCAKVLLKQGHSPIHLSKCKGEINPVCARTLLRFRHSPVHLAKCRGVDGRCAKALLDGGSSPLHLRRCAKR